MKNADLFSLFEISPVPMWVFDVATLRFLDVNIAAVADYGYSKSEFLAMTINDIRPNEDQLRVADIVKVNTQTGSFYKDTFRHVKKDGRIMHVEIASNLIIFEGKKSRLVMVMDVSEKIRAERSLLLSEKRFMALVQDGSDMITIIDQEFRYSYVSPASRRVFGAEPEFFLGKKAFSFIHPDDVATVEREAAQIWTTKHIKLSPYRYRDLAGNWIWVETRATNLFDDPAVQGIVCTAKNVTEQIENEKRIQASIERFNIVSKATSDVVWDWNFLTDTIIWNKAINGVLKHQIDEHSTFSWWKQQIHPDDRERVVAKLQYHIQKSIPKWEDEYRFYCGDGTYKNILDRGFVLLDEQGTAYRMIGTMQDITERKQGEEWLKVLESAVVNASDGILITDGSTPPVTIYVNNALVAMSGFTEEELVGKYPDTLHGAESDQAELLRLKTAIGNKQPCKVELVNYTKSGTPYYVSINLNPVFDTEGRLVRWVSIQRDVSAQRNHMQEIEQQNKKLNEISWMQAHVVRAPLARIMSLVELLANHTTDHEKTELLGHLATSAQELDKIITTIANRT